MQRMTVILAILAFCIQVYSQTFKTDTLSTNIFNGLNTNITSWGDYDENKDYDLFVSGIDTAGKAFSWLMQNNGNFDFVPIQTKFIDISSGDAAWCDLDNDNDIDLIICGTDGDVYPKPIYISMRVMVNLTW